MKKTPSNNLNKPQEEQPNPLKDALRELIQQFKDSGHTVTDMEQPTPTPIYEAHFVPRTRKKGIEPVDE